MGALPSHRRRATDGAASFARSMVAASLRGERRQPARAHDRQPRCSRGQGGAAAPPPAFAATFTLVAVGWACLVRA